MKTKPKTKKAPTRTTAKRLPDDACPRCGTQMEPRRGTLTERVNEDDFRVSGVGHLLCPACGEKLYRLDELRRARETAQAAYRERHGLLSATEVRAIRERLGLTQAELARLLRLGPNSLSRWEANRGVQSDVMDTLLRLLRDVPETLAYLRKRAA